MRDFRHYRNHQLMLDPRVNDVERMLWMGHKQLPTNARYGKLDKSFIEIHFSSVLMRLSIIFISPGSVETDGLFLTDPH